VEAAAAWRSPSPLAALSVTLSVLLSLSPSYAPPRYTCHRYRRFYRESRSRSRTESGELNRDAFRGNAVRPFVKSGNVSRASSLMTRNTYAHTCYVCTDMYVYTPAYVPCVCGERARTGMHISRARVCVYVCMFVCIYVCTKYTIM